jgi:hypothetical protein
MSALMSSMMFSSDMAIRIGMCAKLIFFIQPNTNRT